MPKFIVKFTRHIKVYDNQQSGELSLFAEEVLATMIRCDKRTVFIFQTYSSRLLHQVVDCLAFTSTLCEDKDPA